MQLRTRIALVAVTAAACSTTLAPAASFPAQHYELQPVGGEPLASGFVEIIHPEGPQIYAHQVYVLNGARSNQSYDVVISIWKSNTACAGGPDLVLPAAVLATNTSGNGRADAVFDPEIIAALDLHNRTIGGNVTLLRSGSPAYTNGCHAVELD